MCGGSMFLRLPRAPPPPSNGLQFCSAQAGRWWVGECVLVGKG